MTHKRPIALDPSTFMVPAIMNNMKDKIMKVVKDIINPGPNGVNGGKLTQLDLKRIYYFMVN